MKEHFENEIIEVLTASIEKVDGTGDIRKARGVIVPLAAAPPVRQMVLMGLGSSNGLRLPDQYCDVHTVAAFLNVTPRRVQQLVRRGVIPKGNKRGEYELMPCLHSYQNHLKKLIYRFANFYRCKGGKTQKKERDRSERRIYRVTAGDPIALPIAIDDTDASLVHDHLQLTFLDLLEEPIGENQG